MTQGHPVPQENLTGFPVDREEKKLSLSPPAQVRGSGRGSLWLVGVDFRSVCVWGTFLVCFSDPFGVLDREGGSYRQEPLKRFSFLCTRASWDCRDLRAEPQTELSPQGYDRGGDPPVLDMTGRGSLNLSLYSWMLVFQTVVQSLKKRLLYLLSFMEINCV